MRIIFYFLAIGGATLMFGANAQVCAQQTSPESSQKTLNRRDNAAVSENHHAPSANRSIRVSPKPLPHRAQNSPSKTGAKPQPFASHQSPVVARNGAAPAGTAKSARPARPASAVRPAAPLRNDARHRGANAAVIAGTVNPTGRNTAALNGTTVRRRP